MAYQLLSMTAEDFSAVLADASEDQRRRIVSRRFFEDPGHVWAIDKHTNRYLLLAPRRGAASPDYQYFFQYAARLYDVTAGSYGTHPLIIQQQDQIEDIEGFKRELIEAFRVHRIHGSPDLEPPFVPVFAKKN